MICVKFGGSCVTAKNLGCIANIVDDNVGAVVVSAVGKEFLNDNKLTDLLDEYYRTREQTIWQQICDKIMRLCVLNSIDVDFEKMLFEAKSRIDGRDRYYCLSIGEEITARCVAKYLGRRYVESAEYVVFTNGRLNNAETKRRIGQLVGQKFVCGGFYGGADCDGRQTFERGGGDVSGAIFAAYTDSVLYENRTDVDGVCVADPHKVPFCRVLPQISYRQMRELADCGATVLHPDAIKLPAKIGLPIVVCGISQKVSAGTLVSNSPCLLPTVAVTSKNKNGIFETTVLHNMTIFDVARRLSVAKLLTKKVDKVVLCADTVKLFSNVDVLRLAYDAFVGF